MIKQVFGLLLVVYSGFSFAGFCSYQLQEDANVFEVNCTYGISYCSVTGYVTHLKLSKGYNGMVASINLASDKFESSKPILNIQTYRNGVPKVSTPAGYFSALMVAEQMMMGEREKALLYFDAFSGKPTLSPEMVCE